MNNQATEQQKGELKPCPFCGSEATIKDRRQLEDNGIRGTGVYRAKLVECFCMNAECGASLKGAKLSEKRIVETWNTRSESTRLSELEKSNQELVAELPVFEIMIKELREGVNHWLDIHGEHCGIDARLQNVEGSFKVIKQALARHANLKKEA